MQNEYHIKAVKKIFPSIPVSSIIVFTNFECDIKVKNTNPNIDICTLSNLNRNIVYRFNSSPKKYSMEEIDEIFNKLSEYSQMLETIEFEGKEESFISWLQPIILQLEKEKNNFIEASNKVKKSKRVGNRINIIIGIVCILFSIGYIRSVKDNYNLKLEKIKYNYNLELEEFKQNFKHISEIENEYMNKINEYVDVTDVSLTSDAVSFSAKLSVNNNNYGIALTETSKYIVMTNEGKVFEYDVFGKHLKYNRYYNMIGRGIRESGTLAQIKFYNVNKDDISYIKLTDIELFKLDSSRTLVKENLEIELYNKNDTK